MYSRLNFDIESTCNEFSLSHSISLHPARVCRASNEIVSDAPYRVSFTYSSPPRRCTRDGGELFGLGLIYISNTGPRISRALEVTDDGKKRSRESLTCRPPAGNEMRCKFTYKMYHTFARQHILKIVRFFISTYFFSYYLRYYLSYNCVNAHIHKNINITKLLIIRRNNLISISFLIFLY